MTQLSTRRLEGLNLERMRMNLYDKKVYNYAGMDHEGRGARCVVFDKPDPEPECLMSKFSFTNQVIFDIRRP